jgi:hypothetical protein
LLFFIVFCFCFFPSNFLFLSFFISSTFFYSPLCRSGDVLALLQDVIPASAVCNVYGREPGARQHSLGLALDAVAARASLAEGLATATELFARPGRVGLPGDAALGETRASSIDPEDAALLEPLSTPAMRGIITRSLIARITQMTLAAGDALGGGRILAVKL